MSNNSRRQFLKLATASAALPLVAPDGFLANQTKSEPNYTAPSKTTTDQAHALAIPTVESLRSVTMTHRFGDFFNPPGLTNFWGCAQAGIDVVGIRSVSFPPIAQGEQSTAALFAVGEIVTGVLYVDGQYFASTKQPIEFTWQPDKIERRSQLGDLHFSSTMIVPFERTAVAVAFTIENKGKSRRTTEIKLALRGGVAKSVKPWDQAYSPGEFDNDRTVDKERGAVLFKSKHSGVFAIQGAWPHADEVLPAWLVYKLNLLPGEKKRIVFANVIGEKVDEVQRVYETLVQDFDSEAAKVKQEWNSELKATFTPGNDRFSGFLPTLVTTDDAVRRLYHMSAMSALFFKRTTPHSVYGRTYVTLAPRYWETTTFIWDISLSSMLLAQLDPVTLRRMIETWMVLDIHKHFGTEYLTGAGVGPWYSVNDFAMCRMAREYLRWTGDKAWLDAEVGGQKVIDRLVSYATNWRTLDTNKHGLADYGDVSNLLEAVSSYVHEVASLNAANVFNLRFAAELLSQRGDSTKAEALRSEANALVKSVLDLYVPGKGIWNCRLPDGSVQEVRHCYDFGTVLGTIGSDLSQQQRTEMVRFFREELKTKVWMRALSTHDIDVTFSIRPDHQWTGAYTAWPALALTALYKAGEKELAHDWMQGLAQTATQGPIAQAHFAETAYDAEAGGGARKAPSDQPFINDWACVSGCAYLEPIVESLFGVQAGLFGDITAAPQFGGFDSKAQLRGIRYQGKDYVSDANGIRQT